MLVVNVYIYHAFSSVVYIQCIFSLHNNVTHFKLTLNTRVYCIYKGYVQTSAVEFGWCKCKEALV